ncbi:hypothetical protein AB751O23_DJ_00010, partial [Chlamydiales bacterium SCGC AB-751-O23]
MKEKLIYKSKSFWLVLTFFLIIYLGYGKDFFSFILNASLKTKSLDHSWKVLPHIAAFMLWLGVTLPIFYKKTLSQITSIFRFSLFPLVLFLGLPILSDIGSALIPFNYAIYNVFYSSPLIGDLSYLDGFYLVLYLSSLIPIMNLAYGKEIADEMLRWIWPISRFLLSVVFLFLANTILDKVIVFCLKLYDPSMISIPLAIELITDGALTVAFLYYMY